MKERGHYWKQVEGNKESSDVNFTFDSFIQALHIIATYGFEKMKDDMGTRMGMLYKHIFEVMSRKSASPGPISKPKPGVLDSRDTHKRVVKDGSDIYLMSNRSGASTKSSRAKKNSSQSRKSKKRRSSHKTKGSRRYGRERYTPGSVNASFAKPNVNDSKNSLPALSAIYGSSFDNYKTLGRRNNSGLAAIDLKQHRRTKGFNLDKINQTLDVKKLDKNNSLSLVVPSRITKENLYDNKSPAYGKRNMSMGTNKTYDERKSGEFHTINPLDFDARMNLLNQSTIAKYEGLRNHRYKLYALMQQKRRSGSYRKKSSNSK